MTQFPYSKNKVNKAGRFLCNYLDEPTAVPQDEVELNFLIADKWRSSHAKPLQSINMSLRSFARTCNIDAPIAQRHKRLIRILRKLHREDGNMMLARMEDIGGLRVVFENLADLRKYESHLDRAWSAEKYKLKSRDYIVNPKDSGYRAVHKIVSREERRIEVQLRTLSMHDWANSIERLGRDMGLELKVGHGSGALLNYLRLVADVNWQYELGEEPSLALRSELQRAFEEVRGGTEK